METAKLEIELSHALIKAFHKLPTKYQLKILADVDRWKNIIQKKRGKDRGKAFLNQIDDAIAHDLKSFNAKENQKKITCTKGCHHCCYMNIDIFKEEAIALAIKIRKKQVWFNKEEFEIQKDMTSEDRQNQPPRPCIFLKEGTCSIYKDRPSTCRKYYVVSEPEACSLLKNRGGEVASPLLYNAEIVYTAMAKVSPFPENASMPYMINKMLKK